MMDAVSSIAPSPGVSQPSPWHSPVPYLFGGLAAMMGLIAFALLVLACSFWKFSGYFDNDERDIESGNENGNGSSLPENYINRESSDMEEKYFVIMAGESKPTFLATSSSRTTSFGNSSWRSNSTALTEKSSSSEVEMSEEANQGSGDLLQGRSTENHESADHLP